MVKIKTRNIVIVMLMTLLMLPVEMLMAATRSVEQARLLALRQMTKKGGDRAKGIGKAELKLVYTQNDTKAEPCYYVFATKPTEGFTIVSGDDRFPEIIGYTTNGDFDFKKMPPALKKMLEDYKTFAATATDEQIEEIRNVKAEMSGRATIEPMIKTKWDQPYPYNIYCPYMDNGQQTITGCVATAISQILYHHRCPEKLLADIPSYTTGSYQITMPEIKAGEKYDWDNMCLTYTGDETDAQKEAVARLMLHAGCAVGMDYGPESGAIPNPERLAECFGLDKDYIKMIYRLNYNLKDWSEIVYNELADKRPVLYEGFTPYWAGHCFIVDGYEDGLYSINWGWSGNSDGLFALTGLLDYTADARMTVGMCPDNGKADTNGNPNLSLFTLESFPIDGIRNLRYEGGKLKATVGMQLTNHHDYPNEVKIAVAYRDESNNIHKVSETITASLDNRQGKVFDLDLSFDAEDGKMYRLFAIESKDGEKWIVCENGYGLELPVVNIANGQPSAVDFKEYLSATAKIYGMATGKVGDYNDVLITLSNSASIGYEGTLEFYLDNGSSRKQFLNNILCDVPANGKARMTVNFCPPNAGEYTILVGKNESEIISKATVTFSEDEDGAVAENQGSPTEGWLWGYYRGNSMDDIREVVGNGGAGTYSAMIYVPMDVLKNAKVKGIRLACTDDMGDVTFWIRQYFEGENLASKTIKSEDGKFIEAIFDQPYVVPSSGNFGVWVEEQQMLCVGYTFTSKSAPVFPVAGKCINRWGIAYTNQFGNFCWYATEGGDHAIQLILDKELPETGALAEWNDNNVVVKAGANGKATLTLANNSQSKLTDIDYTVDTGTSTHSGHIALEKPLPAGIDVKGTVEVPFKASSTIAMNTFADFKITKINGKDYSNSKSARLNTITCSKEGTRRTLVEEYTGTGCAFCPRGIAAMEALKKQVGDKAVIVGVHIFNNDDPMYIDYGYYYNNYCNSFPSVIADRTSFQDPASVFDTFDGINSKPTYADVEVSGYWNEDGTAVEAYADITPLTNNVNVKVAFVLKADGLTGPEGEWAQSNAYAWDNPEGYESFPFYEEFKKFMPGGEYGEKSPIEGFVHDNAVISSTYMDCFTEMPALTNLSDGKTKRCSFTIPLDVKDILKRAIIPEKVSVVAIVTDTDSDEKYVINAAEALVKPYTTGISGTKADKVKVMKSYTIDGSETNGTVKGINIVKMSDGTVRKVMVK